MSRPVVLVVDDDPDMRDLAREFLTQAGARVVTADSAAGALTLLQSLLADVVVTDYSMPGRNGLDLVRELRALEPTRAIPAIMVTGNAGVLPLEQQAGPLAVRVLKKPVDFTALAQLIRDLAKP